MICATAVMATVCIATPVQKKVPTQRAHSTRPASPNKLRQVKVFFQKNNESPDQLYAVTRNVDVKNPARSALQAFLAGPNSSEKKRGFTEIGGVPRLKVGKITISRGVARVDFIHVSGYWGDIASVIFRAHVERTMRQFKGVNHVVISVDGVTNFDPSE
jgi:spore germination protein GerM